MKIKRVLNSRYLILLYLSHCISLPYIVKKANLDGQHVSELRKPFFSLGLGLKWVYIIGFKR